MTTLASVIINKAINVLNDAGSTRWSSNELLDWLNDGQREIAVVALDANVKIANLALVAGTKQSVPADCINLINVVRNMGAAGTTPGESPRRVDMKLLDLQRPTWHTDTATLVVKNWMYDPKVPAFLYVYPPMSGTTNIEVEYAAIPTIVASTANNITIDDQYQNPLLDYILWRAFSKDTELAGMQARADSHFQSFSRTLGMTEKANEEGG